MKGTLFGIGVGPGDPELMTLKAVRTCRACHVIAIPHKEREKCLALQIALGAAPELADKPILAVDMPMTKDKAILEAAHSRGAAEIIRLLDEGKDVAFLTLGDPTVYSTYFYIHERVSALGYSTCIIPGITSFCAAAARLGIPLCKNRQELHVIPGTYKSAEALDYPGVKVFMKNDLPEVKRALSDRNLDSFMVENCGLPNEKTYTHTDQLPDSAGYYSLLIVQA